MSIYSKALGELLSSLSPDEMEALLRSLDQVDRPDTERDKHSIQQLPGEDTGEGIFPATYAQILFWRQYDASRIAPNNHQIMAFRIRGELDVDALRLSFQKLSDSQPSIRTVYFEDERDVWQHILPSLPIPFEFLDSDAMPDMAEFLNKPFKLESEPPIRVRLIREGEDAYMLQIVLHHIASDGRSKVIILQRLSEVYNALIAGSMPAAGFNGSNLGAKAIVEREWLSGSGSEETTQYWRESSFVKGLGHPWPEGRHLINEEKKDPDVSNRLDLELGEELSHTLRSYAAERGMTPLQVMMGCYFLCLQRLVDGGAVTVGMPVDMRWREEEASMVGCFMNVVPVSMNAEPSGTIDNYLFQASELMRQAIEHARMPLYRLLEIGYEHDRSVTNMSWKTLVNFKEDYLGSLTLDKLLVEGLPFRQLGSGVDMAITFSRTNEDSDQNAIRLTADIDVSKISRADARSIMETWRSVISQCVLGKVRSVADIDIMLPGERERIHELSGKDNIIDYPNTTLQSIFRQTAERCPDRPAVIEADGRVTNYSDLQAEALKIAVCLRLMGLEQEAVVAVYMQRSAALLASMLGILEAGGAFLLLEPSMPLERLRTMALQGKAAAVITDEGIAAIPGFEDVTLVFQEIRSTDPGTAPLQPVPSNARSLAYVMFTSGSTGVPKGAMVEHVNIINRLMYTKEGMCFGEEDRTLQKSPLSFDVCLTELLMPMFTGGAVVMADSGSEVDVQRIAELVVLHRATYLHFVPGVLKAFLQVPDIRKINGILQMIRCGGESLTEPIMRACLDTLDARLYQSYGPAEAAVAVTLWRCQPDTGHPKPPIGRPNANVDILIMDGSGRPVPPGMTGELWIGGAQTGRGYINNEDESRMRFVDDPLKPGSGRRYYRTGDIARFLPDGNILFIGRMDDQLKVRGVRIEMGEVTAALLRCEGIREAVVLAEPDGQGSNRLRAWVTVKEGVDQNESSIRTSLLALLPGYMIPFRIHVIVSMPLTPHGKTDHRALRALVKEEGEDTQALVPLETETERRLAAIWSELLGVGVQSRDADFFRLGGHSLVAMRLAARIQREFAVTVSLPDFYRDGRLGLLATNIDEGNNKENGIMRLSDMPALLPGERVPMSGSQRRMWMLQQLLSSPSAYHIAHVFTMPKDRSSSEVKEILRSMADRHGILRTRLFQDEDGFWQEEMPVTDWMMDWAELEASSHEDRILLMTKERDHGFDLSAGNGWRARWIEEQDAQCRLLLVFHHAITDEWSTNLFKKEFEARLTGKVKPSSLDKPRYSYIDFSRWQHWTSGQGWREKLEAYWTARLSDPGEPVRLSTDLLRTDGAIGRSATVSRPIDPSIRGLMDAYCQREGLSRFAVWMAVWQILHSRMGTGEDVVIATPVSERDRPEWQDVLGMCLNTLPIRAKVDEEASFRTFSRANHQLLASDIDHVQLPYEEIIRLADGNLAVEHNGLPQVIFVWHGEYEWSEEVDHANDIIPKSRYSQNPISIHISDRTDVCLVRLVYDADLFFAQTAEAIIHRFETVARQVLADPDIIIRSIDILLAGELARILELSGRDNIIDYPNTTLQSIFRQTADRFPNCPAVIEADGRETNYSELESETLKIAGCLRLMGLEQEAVVAVYMKRSAALLASMLGILEAGSAFLLLEPSLPLERLHSIAFQGKVAAVIIDEGFSVIPGFEDVTLVFQEIQSTDPINQTHQPHASDAHSLAYVMFTSGSTGVPKGVMIEHRHIVTRLFSLVHDFALDSGDRTLQKSAFSFDTCITEWFLPLMTGGAVVLSKEGNTTVEVQEMADLIARHHVTYLGIVASVLNHFLEVPDIQKVNGILRIINCGGEEMNDSLMRRCYSLLDVSLNHAYGPTEAAVSVCHWRCRADHSYPSLPIGRPYPNVFFNILDRHGRPVPLGMSGELWIGGAQTGRGYINNEEETKKRFVDDPLAPGSGRRYYRTGDLARFLPDGNILFIGRMDDQLKVRGVRIELGEVTAALLRSQGIREAVVLAEPDGQGSNRLRAWVTVKEGVDQNESSIRTSLLALLPGYMIPFRIHVIVSMPLTPHGKTDHRALRAIVQEEGDDTQALVPLETDTERRLAAIWSELLGVEVQSRDADFFRLGGHSLVAMRLAARIHSSFGVIVPLPDFFSNGRLALLGSSIESARKKLMADGGEGYPPLSGKILQRVDAEPLNNGDKHVYPASHIQSLMWRHDRSPYNIRSNDRGTLYRLRGRLDKEALRSAIDLLSSSQPSLRTVFFECNGEVYQRVLGRMTLPLEHVELLTPLSDLTLAEEMFDMPPFDLDKGPLLRFRVFSDGSDAHLLQISRHHIVFDAVSMVQMFRELSEYYNSMISGIRPEPRKRGVNVGDLAVEEREWLRTEEAENGFRYLMERLDLRGMDHEWPEAGPDKPEAGPGRSEPFSTSLDPGLTQRIRSYTDRRGSTLFRFMLGTYFTALQSLLPGRALTVGVPFSLRRTEEENELIGCLINPLSVTLEPIDAESVAERLRLTEKRLDEVVRYGRIQDSLLLERWKKLRNLNRYVAPRTVLNFREQGHTELTLSGLQVEPIPRKRAHQSRDLVISLDGNADWTGLDNISIQGTFDNSSMTRSQVDLLMNTWESVMRHCTDDEDVASEAEAGKKVRVFAFAGGTGGFDLHSKLQRLADGHDRGFRLQVLADPEASLGLMPGTGLQELARRHAEKILHRAYNGKIWLMGEGLGAIDAFAVACHLQMMGIKEIGLILLDPDIPVHTEAARQVQSVAFTAYEEMPEKVDGFREWIYDLRLKASVRLKRLTHPTPESKSQVFRAALAYGLFDPVKYKARYNEHIETTTQDLFRRYMESGWKEGRHPSERFHAHRYHSVEEAYSPGCDEPVLHALLFGMRRIKNKLRLLECLNSPLQRSEIETARRWLRQEDYKTDHFKGNVRLLMTADGHESKAPVYWQKKVDGNLHIEILDQSSDECTNAMADKIDACLRDRL
jgi:tyrocidine synthetase III